MKHPTPSKKLAKSGLYGHEAKIDALFTEYSQGNGPGAAVGIHYKGALVFSKGYGLADLESGQPITPETPFHVASLSKQFTAFAIALLARGGKVDLDADVRKYLTYVPNFGHKISVRHLILHTSGLRNHLMMLLLGGHSQDDRITQQQIINLVTRQETLNFQPGSDYAYCNTGYTLLAEIVFQVTGRTLREFTTEHIFNPLGMSHTFFLDDITEVVPNRANSYSKRDNEKDQIHGAWAKMPLGYDNVGPGGLYTTITDMGKWADNFASPTVGDKELVSQLCTAGSLDDGTPLKYGFGLERGTTNGHVTLSHSGSDAAFRSTFVRFPDDDLTVTILANTELNLMSKVGAVADLYLPAATDVGNAKPDEDNEADLTRFAGTYVPEHGTSFRLEVHDGKLICHSGRGIAQRVAVNVEGALDFDLLSGQSFTPVFNNTGQVAGLEIPRTGYGPPIHLSRVTAPGLRKINLDEYVGEYRSSELDITYSITADNCGLSMRHMLSNRSLALSPVVPDRFESAGNRNTFQLKMVLVFQRDTKERLCGLLLNTAGDRNIRFVRVGDTPTLAPPASTRAWGTWG